MGFNNPIVGGTALRIPAIQSPNYSPGVSGWIIKITGDAEFNNLIIRGEFIGNNFIINSAGIFLYSGTPAAGNMSGSWASAAGTDTFGNAFPKGLKIYSTLGNIFLSAVDGIFQSTGSSGALVNINDGQITFKANSSDSSTATLIQNLVFTNGSLVISSGKSNGSDVNAEIALVTKTTGNDSQVVISNRAGGQCDFLNNSIDCGRGVQSSVQITANVTGITGTETVLMTIPSMKFVDGRAYRVTLWGLAQSSTASTYYLYRLRKGSATTSGTIYKDLMRIPVLGTANTDSVVNMVFYLVNGSGADITTALTWTASMAAGTGQFTASSSNVAHATVEDVGLDSQWPGSPVT